MTNRPSHTWQLILLVLILMAAQIIIVNPARAEYTISVDGSSVSVTIQTLFTENFTINPTSGYTLLLTGENASQAQTSISSAIATLVPSATATDVSIASSSTGSATTTTLAFTVEGLATESTDALTVNLAWKSFTLAEDIMGGPIHLNYVGRHLATSPVLNNNSSSLVVWTYFVDGKAIPYTSSVEAASSLNIFNYSQISSPLQEWKHSLEIPGPTITLTNSFRHNMTVRQMIREAETITVFFFAGFSQTVTISAEGVASIAGDSLILSTTDTASTIMGVLTILFPAIGLVSLLLERRLMLARRVSKRTPRKK